jgi:hypothetical protein
LRSRYFCPTINANLQALIELGWIAGGALALLMAATALRLVRLARQNPAAAFLLCALAYASALSMVHGRLSRQGELFLLLGASVGILASYRHARQDSQPAPSMRYFGPGGRSVGSLGVGITPQQPRA